MGMALLRMKKGRGGKGGPPPALPPLPMAPAPHHRTAHPAGHAPVVHIHIGPSSAAAHSDEETPEEDLGESSAEETAEGDTPTPGPLLLRALHDKIAAARTARRK